MEVWHDILEGIGLSVIILAVVIGILYYDSVPKHAEVTARKKNGYCVKTIMCDKQTHEPIKIFDSINDAIKYLGLNKNSSSNIVATMKGRKKSAYGYFWRPE